MSATPPPRHDNDKSQPPPSSDVARPHGRTAHWSAGRRFVLLNVGLLIYGVGLAAMINANVGLAPWDAFHVGLARHVPWLTVGLASILAGLVCQVCALLFLKMPIGVGSVLNMILIGLYMDLFRGALPHPQEALTAWAWFVGGILMSGLATGTYIASHFGAGPRDSVVLGLANRTGRSVKSLRTVMELSVLALGWLMGAKVGWGTLVFALTFGPAMSASLALYGLRR
ncbi:MAG TPA: hypothetical protein VM490_01110 [Armatimonadaceae bacterium]|jgi:uncharacterized membrane protein YczE|nr:hypothetical protein [Armatimonadaceae bacterium]